MVGGVVVGGGFCDFKAQPALAAMVMGWLWGRPEQLSLSYLEREKMCAIHKLLQYFIISSVLCL